MISPAKILKEYLITALMLQTPSGAIEWPVYLQSLPDGDSIEDDAVCLMDIVGNKDGRLMAGTVIQHFGVQLKTRSNNYQDGWDKTNAIAEVLDSVLNESVLCSGGTYQINNITRNTLDSIGQEEGTKRRWLFTIDFLLTIKQIV